MTPQYKEEFKKAWYIAFAGGAPVNAPNFNRLFNSDIERIAKTIPNTYWERAKEITVNEALQAYTLALEFSSLYFNK